MLIVSKDGDWKRSFEDIGQVILCESVGEAVKRINSIESILSEEMLNKIFCGAYEEILSNVQASAEREYYQLEDYELCEELEIDSIEVQEVDDGFIPLKISRDRILIKTVAAITTSGHGEILDEDRSIWDSEDNEYIFREYAYIEFTDGEAEVECEIGITFDFDDPEHSAQIDSFKLNNRGNIYIVPKDVSMTPIYEDEDERALRFLRKDLK